MIRLTYSSDARNDLKEILNFTLEFWGESAYFRYKNLLKLGEYQIRANPELPFIIKFPSLSTDIRGLPLWLVPQPDRSLRVKNPPHIIYYRIVDDTTVEILRIFHKGMNRTAILNPKK